MTPSEVLRDLADAMERPDWGKAKPPPEGFVPIGAPRPDVGPDEAWWAWHEHTGEITIRVVDNEVVKIERPTRTIGAVRGPAMKEGAHA